MCFIGGVTHSNLVVNEKVFSLEAPKGPSVARELTRALCPDCQVLPLTQMMFLSFYLSHSVDVVYNV